MQALIRPWGALHYKTDGDGAGPTVVFANSLGTDLRLWDALIPLLPQGMRALRFDVPGHGLSDLDPDLSIASVATDLAALLDHLSWRGITMVGLSMGGLIAQELAARRPELVKALVISNSAARVGTTETWQARIEAVRTQGLAAIAPGVMERWFAPDFRAKPDCALWRNMLIRTAPQGYIAACAALGAADLTEQTARLTLPTLVLAGEADGATPPDLVRATSALIPGAAFHIFPGVGHLPCIEATTDYAAILNQFLKAHADV